MNLLQDLYRILVYEPELNILQAFYNLTGDLGLSIIFLAVFVNLTILPIFTKNYINTQKTRVLQPYIKEIQAKYKDEPQKMLLEIGNFNKKHGINNGITFLALFIQLIFVSGLYLLIADVLEGEQIPGLYRMFFNQDVANFNNQELAFGFMEIGSPARNPKYLWLPLLTGVSSVFYGLYSFRWAPKPKLPEIKKKKEIKKSTKEGEDEEKQPIFDPEAMQKSMEFQSIFVLPVLLFVIQSNFAVGLNIYFLTTSIFSLIRQIFLTNYYAGHTDELIRDIEASDPINRDDDPSNNLEITAKADQLTINQPTISKLESKKVDAIIEEISQEK